MSNPRHWRQHWKSDAPMLFVKKLKIGDGFVLPGDEVTQAHIDLIGLHRLRIWFESGTLVRADQPLPPFLEKIVREKTTFPKVEKGNGSWYIVTMALGADPVKVNGKKKLEELLAT